MSTNVSEKMELSKKTKADSRPKLTLPQIIRRQAGEKAAFSELDSVQKRSVLDYIKNHGLDIEVFGRKWFDVLTGLFYATLYLPDENYSWSVKSETLSFKKFSDLYARVGDGIYLDSCFYGYSFTAQEKKQFGIDITRINYDSFVKETIEDFSFERLFFLQQQAGLQKEEQAKAMARFVRERTPIESLAGLEKAIDDFTGSYNFFEARELFFFLALQLQKGISQTAVIDYLCKHGEWAGVSFGLIVLLFGKEAALKVIEGFNGGYSSSTKKKKVREFKAVLEAYEKGSLAVSRSLGFDSRFYFYYVQFTYLQGGAPLFRRKHLFESFKDFTQFVSGDLRGADLSKAPLSREDVLSHMVDDSTLFPALPVYQNHTITKAFDNGHFWVKQRWLAEDGSKVLSDDRSFDHFFDFVHFLKGDLSAADLLMCDGIERIKGLNSLSLDGIVVRSKVAEALGLPTKLLPQEKLTARCFELTAKNEKQTRKVFMLTRPENDDYLGRVSYISDIHLLHRFSAYKCKTIEDVNYVTKEIAGTIAQQATEVNVIAGDISSELDVFKTFVSSLSAYRQRGTFFFVLGNHEFWPLEFMDMPLEDIISTYKETIASNGGGQMFLLQNNLIYLSDFLWREISEEDLFSITPEELREKTRKARIILFGGVGFAGANESFNANACIYATALALDREREIKESARFLALYEKVTRALQGRNLVVVTHMPMRDWGGKINALDGVVYINGHSHRNYFYDDGKKRIYADNQVGYTGRKLSLKQVAIDFSYDWFEDYRDGIYEITKEDYENFYRGICESLTFNRSFAKLFLIKRDKTYMFLMQNEKGTLLILNGGAIRSAKGHSLEFFYENIIKYSASVKLFLSQYDQFQKKVSKEIKRFGGDGRIHGSIIDIDFYNHLYLNPLDGSVTPYFAYSMVDKHVYDNLLGLLKDKCPRLYANCQKLIGGNDHTTLPALYESDLPVSTHYYYVGDTSMYRVSRILKGLQFTTKYNIVRLWSDTVVGDPSLEYGKLIVAGIIDPDSIPEEAKSPKIKSFKTPPEKPPRPSAEERIAERNAKYIAKVSQLTDNKIACRVYRGPTLKADYQCALCGYEWSIRPDHFKDRQRFKCPKCKSEEN